jgi:hypothetical protein
MMLRWLMFRPFAANAQKKENFCCQPYQCCYTCRHLPGFLCRAVQLKRGITVKILLFAGHIFKEMSMLRKQFLLVTVVLLGAVCPVLAAEAQAPGDLHGNIGITYDTMYVWRGYLVYGHHSAIHPFINLDLMGTGFGLDVQANIANASGSGPDELGYNNGQRWDYTLHYAGALEADQPLETRYMVGYRYFNYPQMDSHTRDSIDLQEMFLGLSFPKLLGVPGLVPGYVVVKGWPSNSDTWVGDRNPNGGTYSGWAHIFMLDYALPVSGMTAESPEQILNFHVETVYNDGVDPRPGGGYTDSDWTHVLFVLSTDLDLGNNMIFTPALNHQITMEDDATKGVAPDHNITWASLTLKYKF